MRSVVAVAMVAASLTAVAIGGSAPAAQAASSCGAFETRFDGPYDPDSAYGTIYRLYRAYFLREPDLDGYAYWIDTHQQGQPVTAISGSFTQSAEFQSDYGDLQGGEFVRLVYDNVLGREPDEDGYEYWTTQMADHGMPRGVVMINFSDSAEYRAKTSDGIPPGFLPEGAAASLPFASTAAIGAVTPDMYHAYAADTDEVALMVDDRITSIVRNARQSRLEIRQHDPGTFAQVGDRIMIPMSGWDLWGGHHTAADGTHFVLLGRENPDEDPSYATVEVRRYDTDWDLLGTGRFTSDDRGIRKPFRSSAPAMEVIDGQLVIHMARLQFVTDDGLNHQVNLTLTGDVDTLDLRSYTGRPYASHSFNQLLAPTDDGESLFFVDHGDAYPRALQAAVVSPSEIENDTKASDAIVYDFDGSRDDDFYNYTGTTMTALHPIPGGALLVGSSVDHSGNKAIPVDRSENRNVYVLTMSETPYRQDPHWLTDYPSHGDNTALDPRVTKLPDGRFVVLFSIQHDDGGCSLGYRLLDRTGTQLAAKTWQDRKLSAVSEVAVAGSQLHWVASPGYANPESAYLFTIDISNPRTPVLG